MLDTDFSKSKSSGLFHIFETSKMSGALKIRSKCTGEHLCRNAISIKLLCNFIEIALWHGCFPVNLRHIFRTPFLITPLDPASVSSFHFLTEPFSVYWEKKIVTDFFYLGFISQTLMIQRTAVEKRRTSLFLSTTFT